MQVTMNSKNAKQKIGVSNPWTEYVNFLPGYVPLPTMWSDDEALMLKGTTLEVGHGNPVKESKICSLYLRKHWMLR